MTKKEILGFVVFIIIMISLIAIGMERFEKIDNGEIILVNQNDADR